jgi:hypothetical protein
MAAFAETAANTPPVTPSPNKAAPDVLVHSPVGGPIPFSLNLKPDGLSTGSRVRQVRQRFQEDDNQNDESPKDSEVTTKKSQDSESLAENPFGHNRVLFDAIYQMHSLGVNQFLQIPQVTMANQ